MTDQELAENPDLLRAELGALEDMINQMSPNAISSRFSFENRKKVLERVLAEINANNHE